MSAKASGSNFGVYFIRNRVVLRLGFQNYRHYLASGLWKKIRRKTLWRDKLCRVCGFRRSTQVHHISYALHVMRGSGYELLAGVCAGCHKYIEFDDFGEKVSLSEANKRGAFEAIEEWGRQKGKRRSGRGPRVSRKKKRRRRKNRRPGGVARVCRTCKEHKSADEFLDKAHRSCSACRTEGRSNVKKRLAEAELIRKCANVKGYKG